MKPNGVLHYDFNFFGLTLPLQKLAFVPRFSSSSCSPTKYRCFLEAGESTGRRLPEAFVLKLFRDSDRSFGTKETVASSGAKRVAKATRWVGCLR